MTPNGKKAEQSHTLRHLHHYGHTIYHQERDRQDKVE